MKFAKELERKALPKWRTQYIQYKALKKVLKAVEQARLNATTTITGTTSSSTTNSTTSSSSSASVLITGQQPSSSTDNNVITDTTEDTNDIRITIPSNDSSSSSSISNAAVPRSMDSVIQETSTKFIILLQEELDKINTFVVNAEKSIYTQQEILEGVRNGTVNPNVVGITTTDTDELNKILTNAEHRLWALISELRDYVELNYIGFYKAAKKHDKITKLKTINSIMKAIDTQPFMSILNAHNGSGATASSMSGSSIASYDSFEANNLEKNNNSNNQTKPQLIRRSQSVGPELGTMVADNSGSEDRDQQPTTDISDDGGSSVDMSSPPLQSRNKDPYISQNALLQLNTDNRNINSSNKKKSFILKSKVEHSDVPIRLIEAVGYSDTSSTTTRHTGPTNAYNTIDQVSQLSHSPGADSIQHNYANKFDDLHHVSSHGTLSTSSSVGSQLDNRLSTPTMVTSGPDHGRDGELPTTTTDVLLEHIQHRINPNYHQLLRQDSDLFEIHTLQGDTSNNNSNLLLHSHNRSSLNNNLLSPIAEGVSTKVNRMNTGEGEMNENNINLPYISSIDTKTEKRSRKDETVDSTDDEENDDDGGNETPDTEALEQEKQDYFPSVDDPSTPLGLPLDNFLVTGTNSNSRSSMNNSSTGSGIPFSLASVSGPSTKPVSTPKVTPNLLYSYQGYHEKDGNNIDLHNGSSSSNSVPDDSSYIHDSHDSNLDTVTASSLAALLRSQQGNASLSVPPIIPDTNVSSSAADTNTDGSDVSSSFVANLSNNSPSRTITNVISPTFTVDSKNNENNNIAQTANDIQQLAELAPNLVALLQGSSLTTTPRSNNDGGELFVGSRNNNDKSETYTPDRSTTNISQLFISAKEDNNNSVTAPSIPLPRTTNTNIITSPSSVVTSSSSSSAAVVASSSVDKGRSLRSDTFIRNSTTNITDETGNTVPSFADTTIPLSLPSRTTGDVTKPHHGTATETYPPDFSVTGYASDASIRSSVSHVTLPPPSPSSGAGKGSVTDIKANVPPKSVHRTGGIDWEGRDTNTILMMIKHADACLVDGFTFTEAALRVISPELASSNTEREKRLAPYSGTALEAQLRLRERANDHQVNIRNLHDAILASKLELFEHMIKIIIRQVELTFPEGAAGLEHLLQGHHVMFGQYMSSRAKTPTRTRIDLFHSLLGKPKKSSITNTPFLHSNEIGSISGIDYNSDTNIKSHSLYSSTINNSNDRNNIAKFVRQDSYASTASSKANESSSDEQLGSLRTIKNTFGNGKALTSSNNTGSKERLSRPSLSARRQALLRTDTSDSNNSITKGDYSDPNNRNYHPTGEVYHQSSVKQSPYPASSLSQNSPRKGAAGRGNLVEIDWETMDDAAINASTVRSKSANKIIDKSLKSTGEGRNSKETGRARSIGTAEAHERDQRKQTTSSQGTWTNQNTWKIAPFFVIRKEKYIPPSSDSVMNVSSKYPSSGSLDTSNITDNENSSKSKNKYTFPNSESLRSLPEDGNGENERGEIQSIPSQQSSLSNHHSSSYSATNLSSLSSDNQHNYGLSSDSRPIIGMNLQQQNPLLLPFATTPSIHDKLNNNPDALSRLSSLSMNHPALINRKNNTLADIPRSPSVIHTTLADPKDAIDRYTSNRDLFAGNSTTGNRSRTIRQPDRSRTDSLQNNYILQPSMLAMNDSNNDNNNTFSSPLNNRTSGTNNQKLQRQVSSFTPETQVDHNSSASANFTASPSTSMKNTSTNGNSSTTNLSGKGNIPLPSPLPLRYRTRDASISVLPSVNNNRKESNRKLRTSSSASKLVDNRTGNGSNVNDPSSILVRSTSKNPFPGNESAVLDFGIHNVFTGPGHLLPGPNDGEKKANNFRSGTHGLKNLLMGNTVTPTVHVLGMHGSFTSNPLKRLPKWQIILLWILGLRNTLSSSNSSMNNGNGNGGHGSSDLAYIIETPIDNPSSSATDGATTKLSLSPRLLMKALYRRWRPPFFEWITEYKWNKYLWNDIVAGLTIGVVLVPQGLAYATLAGLPPVYGVYTGFPGVIYALFGTSKHAAIGPMSIPALLIAAGIASLRNPPTSAVEYASIVMAITCLCGLILLAMGWLHLGFIVRFISRPVLSGFTSAAAILTMVSVVKDLIGVPLPRSSVLQDYLVELPRAITKTHLPTFFVSLSALVILFILPKWKRTKKIPASLLTVILYILIFVIIMKITGDTGLMTTNASGMGNIDTLITNMTNLTLATNGTLPFSSSSSVSNSLASYATRQGIGLVGDVPSSFPSLLIPHFGTIDRILELIPIAISVTFVGFIESIAVAKMYALKFNYEIDASSELKALGTTNIVGSIVQSFPVMGAFGRSAVNEAAGARSQMSGIIAGGTVILLLLLVMPALYYLPKPVLAALIVMAVRSLVDISGPRHLWTVDKRDFLIMSAAFFATLFLGVLIGVLSAMVFSLGIFIATTTQPRVEELGRLTGTVIYRHLGLVGVQKIPEVKIIRFLAPLFFANCSVLKERLLLEFNLRKALPPRLQWRALILCFSSVSQIDSTSIQALEEIAAEAHSQNIPLLIAAANAIVEEALEDAGFVKKIGGSKMFYRRVHEAVRAVLLYQVTSADLPQTDRSKNSKTGGKRGKSRTRSPDGGLKKLRNKTNTLTDNPEKNRGTSLNHSSNPVQYMQQKSKYVLTSVYHSMMRSAGISHHHELVDDLHTSSNNENEKNVTTPGIEQPKKSISNDDDDSSNDDDDDDDSGDNNDTNNDADDDDDTVRGDTDNNNDDDDNNNDNNGSLPKDSALSSSSVRRVDGGSTTAGPVQNTQRVSRSSSRSNETDADQQERMFIDMFGHSFTVPSWLMGKG